MPAASVDWVWARWGVGLTPFGYDAGGVVWYKQGDWRWAFYLHTYTNNALTLPGLEAEPLDAALSARLGAEWAWE